MQKIAIIGSSGSGKSTLALQLNALLKLPVYHLDQYNWLPGWQTRPFEDFAQDHTQLCKKEKWIIEGIYTRTFQERIEHADTIIFLDFARSVCIWRILKRTLHYYNKQTPSSAFGCHERFDLKFLNYVWDFNNLYKKEIISLLEKNKEKSVYIFKNQAAVHTFLKDFDSKKKEPIKNQISS